MYKDDLKDENGQYSKLNYIKRALKLIGWNWFNMFAGRYIPETGITRRVLLYLDYIGCMVRYGAATTDYFEYRF